MSATPREQLYQKVERGEKIVVVDLFCGAGGMSSGAVRILNSIADDVGKPVEEIAALIAVNHWDRAVKTHQENHPWATHYNAKVQELRPRELYWDEQTPIEDGDEIDLLIACPDCTYFSTARGGGPKDPDSRATPREILDFVERLNVRNILFENVPKFEDWGPLDEDNHPIKEKEGEYFDAWITQLTIEGFNVEWDVLNAADYGDATSRKRLFVIGRKDSGVSWPAPTHSETENDTTKPWRTAADIIDWSDPGESIWVRDLDDGRRSPLANNTMRRIAEGIRRHGGKSIQPFADALEEIGPDDVRELRESVVPAIHAATVADAVSEPFLVKYYGTSHTSPVDSPVDTITAGGQEYALCTPYVLSQHTSGVPRNVDRRPVSTIGTTSRGISLCRPETFVLGQQSGARARPASGGPCPTVATKGAISRFTPELFVLPKNGRQRGLFSNKTYRTEEQPLHTIVAGRIDQGYTVRPYLVPFYGERSNQRPRTHSIDEPNPTIPASAIKRGVSQPYLVEYYGNGSAQPVTNPVPTVTTKDRFALVVPELFPFGIDILFRMLKPSELAAAMGFGPDYTFTGNKTETVKQIGNAVPVNLAASLCEELLLGGKPTLKSFGEAVPRGVESDD